MGDGVSDRDGGLTCLERQVDRCGVLGSCMGWRGGGVRGGWGITKFALRALNVVIFLALVTIWIVERFICLCSNVGGCVHNDWNGRF